MAWNIINKKKKVFGFHFHYVKITLRQCRLNFGHVSVTKTKYLTLIFTFTSHRNCHFFQIFLTFIYIWYFVVWDKLTVSQWWSNSNKLNWNLAWIRPRMHQKCLIAEIKNWGHSDLRIMFLRDTLMTRVSYSACPIFF